MAKREKLLREDGWAVKVTSIAGRPVGPLFHTVIDMPPVYSKDEANELANRLRDADRSCDVVPVTIVERRKGKVKK